MDSIFQNKNKITFSWGNYRQIDKGEYFSRFLDSSLLEVGEISCIVAHLLIRVMFATAAEVAAKPKATRIPFWKELITLYLGSVYILWF